MYPAHKITRTVFLPTGPVSLSIPAGVHVPPASSVDLASLLDVQPGERVLDLGCGSGLLSLAAAKLGAGHVLATDSDPQAVEAACANARHNSVAHQIIGRPGSWYSALTDSDRRSFEVIVANPPQTPGERPFGPRYGGPDGIDHLTTVIENAPRYLLPPAGRLFILVITLAHTKAVLRILEQYFDTVTIMKTTTRVFTPLEYDGYDHGLFSYLLSQREKGLSAFEDTANSNYAFRNVFIRAKSPR